VPALTAAPENGIQTNCDSDRIRLNIVLSSMLIGLSKVEPVVCDGLKAYKDEVCGADMIHVLE
jgi:hypothetical protein